MPRTTAADHRKISVQVGLDIHTITRLDAMAAKAGVSRSALLRTLIENATQQEESEDWIHVETKSAQTEVVRPHSQGESDIWL